MPQMRLPIHNCSVIRNIHHRRGNPFLFAFSLFLALILLLSGCRETYDPSIAGKTKEMIEAAYLDYFSDAIGSQVQSLDGILTIDSTTDDRVYFYYGTFQDTIVWFSGRPDGDAVSLELAGNILYYPTFGEFLATKNGQCYTLGEAYDLGYITDENVAQIAQRHIQCNQSILGADRPTTTSKEAQLPFSELSASSQIIAQAAQAYEAHLKESSLFYTSEVIENFELSSEYFGTFGGSTVWFMEGTTEAIEEFEIAGNYFWNPNGCAFYVCKEGRFYSMGEAFLLGYLSADDIAIVCQRHKDYVSHRFGGQDFCCVKCTVLSGKVLTHQAFSLY